MNPPPESLKVHRSRQRCRLELAKFDVPDKDINLLSDYIAANYNERCVLHTLCNDGKREAYMLLARLLRLVRTYTTLHLLDGDVIEHVMLICRVQTCFPDNHLISTLANVVQNNLANTAEEEQRLEKNLQLCQAQVDRVTQMDDELLQPYIVKLNQARDEARDKLNRVQHAREALAKFHIG